MNYKVEAKVETEMSEEQKEIEYYYSRREHLLRIALENSHDSEKLDYILNTIRGISKHIKLMEKAERGVLI